MSKKERRAKIGYRVFSVACGLLAGPTMALIAAPGPFVNILAFIPVWIPWIRRLPNNLELRRSGMGYLFLGAIASSLLHRIVTQTVLEQIALICSILVGLSVDLWLDSLLRDLREW